MESTLYIEVMTPEASPRQGATVRARAGRAYAIRFGTASVLYTVLMLVGMPLARSQPAGSFARYALVCLPVIGVAIGVRALWRLVHEADELQSRRLMEALNVSIAGTILVTFCLGMMQVVGAPALPWFWVIPVWAASFGIGVARTAWKYR
ncbi:hypothetical protein SDC9_85600 [bioreactor metagenome]|uniref:Uncharacterized protein n=2 Tax=root TaxID=1 RepID=A0A644ZDZ1_9ZZZZ